MGFFSKLWGGVKKVVKKIGSGIKKAVKWVGKQYSKLGIVGQIALMFILPGIGAAIGAAYGTAANALVAAGGWAATAGKVLMTAGKFAATVGNAYRTVTQAVSGFITKVGGSMVNQMGSMVGLDKAIISSAPTSVGQGFNQWMSGISDNFNGITSPFSKGAAEVTKVAVESPYEASFSEMQASSITTPSPTTSMPTVSSFEVPSFKPEAGFDAKGFINKDMVFAQDLQDTYANQIIKAETAASKSLASKTIDYAGKVVGQGVTGVVSAASSAIGRGAAESLGLAPESTVTSNQYSVSVPEFNHRQANTAYETAGFGYGALPSNRVEFFASQQPTGDYGASSFNSFSRLRGVA